MRWWNVENGTNPPTGSGLNVMRMGSFAVSVTHGDPKPNNIAFDQRRYTINKTSAGQALAPGDSGGPCFDVATGTQTGVQSTVKFNASTHLLVSGEQTKFNYIRQWVIDTISNN